MQLTLRESFLEDLRGSILLCADCQRPTAHFTAAGGVPVCGYCGATPVEAADLVKWQEASDQRMGSHRAGIFWFSWSLY